MSVLEEEAPATKPDGVGITAALALHASVFVLQTRGLLSNVLVDLAPHVSLRCTIGDLLALSSRFDDVVCPCWRRLSAARYRRTRRRIFASRESLGFLTLVLSKGPFSALPASSFFCRIRLPFVHILQQLWEAL